MTVPAKLGLAFKAADQLLETALLLAPRIVVLGAVLEPEPDPIPPDVLVFVVELGAALAVAVLGTVDTVLACGVALLAPAWAMEL